MRRETGDEVAIIVGVPKEIKREEYRVGIVPGGVRLLLSSGRRVLIERGADEGAGIMDEEYAAAGATAGASAADPALAKGVNIYRGHVTNEAVARDLNYPYQPLSKVLKMS